MNYFAKAKGATEVVVAIDETKEEEKSSSVDGLINGDEALKLVGAERSAKAQREGTFVELDGRERSIRVV